MWASKRVKILGSHIHKNNSQNFKALHNPDLLLFKKKKNGESLENTFFMVQAWRKVTVDTSEKA